ncbi:putative NH(3)-dependent NAD(+) synthetase [Halalkalicoccus paucihalophilus]|uniref:NH(3)-dependent NAD(+) synthetase n=1 Tax=Halalkalicoccus paucihalophilus TaxID=1008153 RepID=A0A151AEM4_9EURY|nr:NAD+ synthase [Halalkalicoccus paucihalophilus]KYH26138.1 putative NH(3)-dependent NAD(+) synthetase [Halalkalicoccus paucihalophilus]
MIDLRFSEEELDTVYDRITGFIADTVAEAGADGAVLGLSGGIDSTLTAYLAVDALGSENLHGLVLPGEVSSEGNMSDAERVARDLEIGYDVIEINPIVETFVSALPEVEGDHVAVGNARARTRAVLNYLLANHENRVVLGTGNRAEAAVGYFTKYGDGGVDCHPIGNLYKQQVRHLAHHLGVPEDLAEKTPTAELWEDQTDEGELGIDYDTLDAVLALHVDGPLSVAATSRVVGCEEDVVRDVDSLYERSAHKRTVPPAPER